MIKNVLIVGGGIGGMSAALAMARLGIAVTLIDSDPKWRVYGAGITITGMSLRAFDDLGVLDDIRTRGFVHDGMRPMRFTGEPMGPPMRAPAGSPPGPARRGHHAPGAARHPVDAGPRRRDRRPAGGEHRDDGAGP